jgi:hypothetical protein
MKQARAGMFTFIYVFSHGVWWTWMNITDFDNFTGIEALHDVSLWRSQFYSKTKHQIGPRCHTFKNISESCLLFTSRWLWWITAQPEERLHKHEERERHTQREKSILRVVFWVMLGGGGEARFIILTACVWKGNYAWVIHCVCTIESVLYIIKLLNCAAAVEE